MEDWNKFGDSGQGRNAGFTMRDADQQSQHSETDSNTYNYYTGYEEPVNAKKKEPKYVTRKAFVITLIFAMILSAAVGAGAYALAISTLPKTPLSRAAFTF